MSRRPRRQPPVREVVVPERRIAPEFVPEEKLSLAELVEQVRVSGGWTPKKPDRTVFNFGHDITNKTLPAGQWTKIFTLPAEYSPFIVYWKILIADTPLIRCMPYIEGRPASPRGIDLQNFFTYGIWQPQQAGVWCNIYDTVNSRYGLTFNVVEPVHGSYEFHIQNYDTVPRNLTYMYLKWYQWEKRRIVEVE